MAVKELPYGAYALALYASGHLPKPDEGVDVLAGHAERGCRYLIEQGIDLEGANGSLLELNLARLAGSLTDGEYRAAMAMRYPDAERFERCLGADAYRLLTGRMA